MCLGVPGRVVSGRRPRRDRRLLGRAAQVRLDVVDEPVAPGDYILNHVGFAIRRIPDERDRRDAALYEELLQASGPRTT